MTTQAFTDISPAGCCRAGRYVCRCPLTSTVPAEEEVTRGGTPTWAAAVAAVGRACTLRLSGWYCIRLVEVVRTLLSSAAVIGAGGAEGSGWLGADG